MYFSVLKTDSENGLSLLTLGRLNEAVTLRAPPETLSNYGKMWFFNGSARIIMIQSGFFDTEDRYAKLNELDPLPKLNDSINWSVIGVREFFEHKSG